jgi:glycerol-3-phosphate acyltransferase PlsY
MNSNLSGFLLLAPGAYLLGSLPFSVWCGRLFLNKDIRNYGDHNPGSANVFIAGNPVLGMAVVLLDIGKGVPFILLAKTLDLSLTAAVAVGICAILGHAFSPFLHFHGGKGVATTFGVLIGLWQPAWLFPFCFAALAGLILWESHAWVMLLAPASTIVFMLLIRAGWLPLIFMLCIQALFTFKYASDIDGPPRLRTALLKKFMHKRQA